MVTLKTGISTRNFIHCGFLCLNANDLQLKNVHIRSYTSQTVFKLDFFANLRLTSTYAWFKVNKIGNCGVFLPFEFWNGGYLESSILNSGK